MASGFKLPKLPPQLAQLGRQASRLPWYYWAGGAAGAAALLGALGAKPPEGGPPPPGDSPKGPMPTIKQGATGQAVSVWQGVVGVKVTGVFDAATVAATKQWQAAHGLTADGVVGPKSWTAAGYPTPSTPGGNPNPGGNGGNGPDFVGATPIPDSGGFQLSNNLVQRDAQIEGAILDGAYEHEWAPITVSCKGHTGTFYVSRMELALAYGDARLIVSSSYRSSVGIAEMLGAYMLTSKLADEIQRQADIPVNGQSRNWQGTGTDNSGSTTKRLVQFSNELYDLVAGDPGLVSILSKIWAITIKNFTGPNTPVGTLSSRHNGANHGLYSFNADGTPKTKAPGPGATPGGLAVIQNLGLAHDPNHVDYSQLNRFVRKDCVVDGQTMDVADVARDPELSCLVSDEGPLPDMVHPDFKGGGSA